MISMFLLNTALSWWHIGVTKKGAQGGFYLHKLDKIRQNWILIVPNTLPFLTMFTWNDRQLYGYALAIKISYLKDREEGEIVREKSNTKNDVRVEKLWKFCSTHSPASSEDFHFTVDLGAFCILPRLVQVVNPADDRITWGAFDLVAAVILAAWGERGKMKKWRSENIAGTL